MATEGFMGYIGVRGANGQVSVMAFDMDVTGVLLADKFANAVGGLNNIAVALDEVTDGEIAYQRIAYVAGGSSNNGAGDVFEKAAVSVDLGGGKAATIFVPAPAIGIFNSATGPGRDQVDVDDADLMNYVETLGNNVFVSDGEKIADFTPLSGRRVIVRRKLGN
jgi:hypothetical protein